MHATGQLDPGTIMREALAARDRGDVQPGLASVSAALAQWPDHAGLWQVLGLLHRYEGDSVAAIEALEQARRRAPSDPRIVHARARVTMEAGLPAAGLFEQARRLDPADGDMILGQAAALMAQGLTAAAIDMLSGVLKTRPEWLDGQTTAARMRWLAGLSDFTADYQQGLARRPKDAALWMQFLNALLEAEQFDVAQRALPIARSELGDAPSLDVVEAICASETGDHDRADRFFATIDSRRDVAVAVRHVRHLLRTGRPDKALALALPLVNDLGGDALWPYISTIWRLTADSRSEWLDGNPSFVRTYDLADEIDLAEVAACLRVLHRDSAYPLGQSVRGGTQTDGPLFARADPVLRRLSALLKDRVREYADGLAGIESDHPYLRRASPHIRFAGSWSVRLSGSGHHRCHVHPLGWLSSAFYVALPRPDDLGPAPAGWLSLGEPPAELGIRLDPLRRIEPLPGRLVIFPSLMWHGTVPFAAGERLTVAFDVAGRPGT